MKFLLRRLFGIRVVRMERHPALSETDLQQIFHSAPENPLMRGVHDVLDSLILERTESALPAEQSDKLTNQALGGVDALLEMKERLQSLEANARRKKVVIPTEPSDA